MPSPPGPPPVPTPPRRPHRLVAHGEQRVDDWYWLRERDDPEVLAHLRAENAHTDGVLAPLAPLRARLFEELRSRIQETDASPPVPYGPFEYYRRTEAGRAYVRHCRRPRGGGAETVVLDENELAAEHDFLALGVLAPAPDHRVVAYSVDTTGGERFTLRFRDVARGRDLADQIPDTSPGLAWSDDGRTVLYVRPDAAVRPHQVWRHTLGTDPATDALVLAESDERFFVDVHRTRSGRFVVIESASKLTTEVWTVPTAEPERPATLVAPRRHGIECSLEHDAARDRFLILTDDGAPDFRCLEVPVATPGPEHWRELVPARVGVRLEAVLPFPDHLVLAERVDGLERLSVVEPDGRPRFVVDVPDPVHSIWPGENPEYATSTLRYGSSSLVRPRAALDLDLATGTSTLVKREPVLGGFDPADYRTVRLHATAPDGTPVPVSLVARADVEPGPGAPLVLYGYGAYEHSVDPVFAAARLPLLDRGVVFAIAHVRGGGELGRQWYEDGRLGHKPHTFGDFVACAEHLVDTGWAAPGRLVARGRSAGGLLVGAVTNLRPDLWRAVVAEVPFVDVLTTMQDPSIPLTVTEWEEWGDPIADADAYRTIRSYSPYDNVAPRPYPEVLATAGLHDSRVQYWEPAKWVAKLRANTTRPGRILLRTDLGAGHAGPTGRYETWQEEAFVLAFVLDALGVEA